MFYSEQLLSKEGPLAHVWLAANLERKLTKHQLLTTDISKTSEAIATSSTRVQANQIQTEPLALRLTGTLLYGIVRIYSRKAKYLLDDVSDALLRLKTALRSSNSIILPPQATVIPSVKQVTLQDTVTANDLLWQEPLNFDEDTQNDVEFEENANSFDNSIEMGRGLNEVDELAGNNDDDIQLDFDLGDAVNNDMSIEVGRDLETALADESAMPDLTFGGISEDNLGGLEPDFGEFNDFGSVPDFDQPQTPRSPAENLSLIPSSPMQEKQQRRKRTNKFTESDVVRTSKRRLVIDEVTELTSAQIREQLNTPNIIDDSPMQTTMEERLSLLTQISMFDKIQIEKINISIPDVERLEENENFIEDFDLGNPTIDEQNDNVNFTALELQEEQGGDGVEFDNIPEPLQPEEEENNIQSQLNKDEIMEKISSIVSTANETTFSHVLENSSDEINFPKRHATNCFFEILVMASADKIGLKQDGLFSEISIFSRL